MTYYAGIALETVQTARSDTACILPVPLAAVLEEKEIILYRVAGWHIIVYGW
jgi:hypothetical protein